jgi:hypothetical protein
MRRTTILPAAALALALVLVSCGGSSGNSASDTTSGAGSTSSTASSSTSGGGGTSGGSSSVKDACAALPAETIQSITGKDPGKGEPDHAGGSTACRYNGEATLVVEIDPGSDIASAQTSEEAYGNKCTAITDIGDKALFCTGGFPAQGYIGEIIWTDGDHLFYVQYNEGNTTPTKDVPLKLAKALQA